MRIAFYLNPQETGRCRRFEAIAQHLPPTFEIAVLGLGTRPPVTNLDRRVEQIGLPALEAVSQQRFAQQTSQNTPVSLLSHEKSAAFYQAMVSFLTSWQPDLLVVDTGLEAAALARECGISTLYIREHGQRWDQGHKLAYQSASSLLAPFPSEMEQSDCPDWIREKTLYSGGFSRFSQQEKAPHKPISYADDKPNILVMTGFKRADVTPKKFAEAASATPQWQWNFVGPQAKLQAPKVLSDNSCYHGTIRDFWPYLCHADLVVSSAGHSLVMEIATANAPAIFIPDNRPFSAQQCRAAALKEMGLGIVCTGWPQPSEWPDLYQRSHNSTRMGWQQLQTPNAARFAAQHIAQIAQQHLATSTRQEVQSAA